MPIELTDQMRTLLASALADGYPAVIAMVDPEGQPNITFRGTLQVVSTDQLGMWSRRGDGALVQAIAHNPKVEVLYRNAAERVSWRWQGRARLVDDPVLATRLFEESPEVERNMDPERNGTAVVIDVDRVIQRGAVVMSRE